MSLRKKLSYLLPKIIQSEDNKFYKGKTINNYRLSFIKNQIKSIGNLSIKTEVNHYIDKLKISPKNQNIGYNTEKTEYSSQINDCLSRIQANSEIKPIYTSIKLNDSISPNYKTETNQFFNSSKNIFNNTKTIYPKKTNHKTSTCWHKTENNNSKKINNIDMENIIKYSNNYAKYRTPKIKRRKNIFSNNIKNKKVITNNRFNSLNCFIDNYIQIDENKLVNRYIPNFGDYFSKTDQNKLIEKGKNLLTEKEKIKLVFKDTKLIMAMCDYLNSSFAKIKNEKRLKLNTLNQEIRNIKKNKKYMKTLNSNIRNNLIPISNIFKMKQNIKNDTFKKAPMIYKNGYFSKSFYCSTTLTHSENDKNEINQNQIN